MPLSRRSDSAPVVQAGVRRTQLLLAVAVLGTIVVGVTAAWLVFGRRPVAITVDYPLDGAMFPPEFPPPSVEWRDESAAARVWAIDVSFGEAAPTLHAVSPGPPPTIGRIDERALGPTNERPTLTPQQQVTHTWRPEPALWEAIKSGSTSSPAVITITGYADESRRRAVSRGRVSMLTSTDPVEAPIFFRDVPLMPSKGEKGVIKPLDQKSVPLIAWRLRNVADTESRVVLEGLHSCTNCHSVSRDGKTMGMDLDGPRANKGLYALFPIEPRSTITRERVVEWSTYRGKLGGKLRVAFMSQVSPTGNYVVTTINDPGKGQTDYKRQAAPEDLYQNYYIANFANYRFLQVFYPTRGVLAWYGRATGILQPLPGADDPKYVHANATWSPDERFLVFARAEARDAYPPGASPAERPNDPKETQIKFDLYRMPFNDGRGGPAVPIAGASQNGMSNSFPKISPDGKFIVFVKAKNGQLMRPDGKLHIVPIEGGEARPLRANTPLMNSWHSFSPNGRWLVFSSKSRSPYTQMFLTHIDEQGNDTPAILIENATAANRAVNIPEFVNIPPDGLLKIDAPVAEYYRLIDEASDALNAGNHATAIPLFQRAIATNPGDAFVHNSYGSALAATARLADAIAQFREAIAISADYAEAHNNLGSALVQAGRVDEAIPAFQMAVEQKPDFMQARAGLGGALAQRGRYNDAIPHLLEAARLDPTSPGARANLCLALSLAGRPAEAIPHAEEAVRLSDGGNPLILDMLGRLNAQAGRMPAAIDAARRAIAVARRANDAALVRELEARLVTYEAAARDAGARVPAAGGPTEHR